MAIPKALTPLQYKIFRYVWIVAAFSYTGTWMHTIAAGWLMTSLSHSSNMAAMVQFAMNLPVFIFTLPSGVIADTWNLRRYICVVQSWMAIMAMMLAILTLLHFTTPTLLLVMTFMLGIGAALNSPAWQTAISTLVPPEELQKAVTLNSISVGLARAIGPAIGGLLLGLWGSPLVFLLNGLSFVGIVYVFYCYYPKTPSLSKKIDRHFIHDMQVGYWKILSAKHYQAILIKSIAFFFCSTIFWALLPWIVRYQLQGTPEYYGFLATSFGIGAIISGFTLTYLRERFSSDHFLMAASLIFSLVLLGVSMCKSLLVMCIISFVGGCTWISATSTLISLASLAFSREFRARSMSIYYLSFSGSIALGSAFWGKLSSLTNVTHALQFAALTLLIGMLLTFKLTLTKESYVV
jgi:MFS family permease